MRFSSKIVLIASLCYLRCKAADIIGNLAFYGRGQRHLPNYWNEIKDIKGTNKTKVYFPFNESDDNSEASKEKREEEQNDIIDNARNYPLVLYLPGRKANETYSKLLFSVSGGETQEIDKSLDLSKYFKIKSEMKIVMPTVDDFVSDMYTEDIKGAVEEVLSSRDIDLSKLSEIDFSSVDIHSEEFTKLWEENVDVKLFLETRDLDEDDESELYEYEIEGFDTPTTNWKECVGEIDQKFFNFQKIYSDFSIRNYGILPVYVYIGNTMFLKKDPTYMVKDGVIQNGFQNWSWHRSQNTKNKTETYFEKEVYEGDPEKKNAVKFVAKEDGDAAYYVHIDSGISSPPEGVSFRIRPLVDNQFKFKIDNKKEYNLTEEYLIHRNCQIPIGVESEFLIDTRSLAYSDPKFMLINDINGFWVLTISEIIKKKEELSKTDPQEALDYADIFYFYDFILHHSYPEEEELSKYAQVNLFDEGKCNIKLETHEDWEKGSNPKNPVIPWPDDIGFDTILKSKNKYDSIEDSGMNNGSENGGNQNAPGPENSGATDLKPMITLGILSTLLVLHFLISN